LKHLEHVEAVLEELELEGCKGLVEEAYRAVWEGC